MATPLLRPMQREVLIGGEPYKVVISPDGLRFSRLRRRVAVDVAWEAVLHVADTGGASDDAKPSEDLPRAVSIAVAQALDAALEALSKSRQAVQDAATLPPILFREFAADQVYGQPRVRDDWFVEPLMTLAEVADVLRVAPRHVQRFPIKSLRVGGELRFRQSAVREFISANERAARGV